MMKWKCFMCGTDMEEKTISTTAGWGKYTLTIDGVKAHVCPECNETIYSSEEVHMLQELGKSLSVLSDEKRPDMLNVTEVADLLRISNQSVYNMIKDGRLRALKIGREWRFSRKDIVSILNDSHEFQVAARNLYNQQDENDSNIITHHLQQM